MSTSTADTSAFSLNWSLRVDRGASADAPGTLTLAYEIEAREEVFISDRLWDFDDDRNRIADPFGVYRFVVGDSLRLVFAQAPLPRGVVPRLTFQPLYSRVRAGETLRKQLTLSLPVREYSSLSRNIDAPSELERVARVTLVMGHRARSAMQSDPAPPPFESADDAGYIVHSPSIITSTMTVEPLPVLRRTQSMARYALAGDAAHP